MYGGAGNAEEIRVLAMQRRHLLAQEIAGKLARSLIDSFGANDKLDGYRIDDMSDDERDYHRSRGRLTQEDPPPALAPRDSRSAVLSVTMTADARADLLDYLNWHEDDIASGSHDFGSLRRIFAELFGRPPR